MCESPVFERGCNWRARQKGGRSDGGRESSWDSRRRACVTRVGEHGERERERQVCDVIEARRDVEMWENATCRWG